jgi:SAM-dependent methyltransferase
VAVPSAYYERYYGQLAKYGEEHALHGPGEAMNSESEPTDPSWLAAKADHSAQRIAKSVRSRQARVLDIGCGTGSLLAGLAREGFADLHGIDPSPSSVRVAQARPGVRASVGSFAELPSGIGTFDCICATGVFEHLWDPDEAVSALLTMLAPGGVIYVEVPDATCYLDPYISPYEDFNTEHVNHFSLQTLRSLAARFGLHTASQFQYKSPLTASVSTGAIATVWMRGENRSAGPALDDQLVSRLRGFADRSRRDLDIVSNRLEEALVDDTAYILWGIGESAFKLLALPPLARRQAFAYIDSNSARQTFQFDGMGVRPPSSLESSSVPIVVSSLIRADAILTDAATLGLKNPTVRVDSVLHA